MQESRITSSRELFEHFHNFTIGRSWVFRGQRVASWKILPKAGRNEYASQYRPGLTEKSVFESWKRYAVHFIQQTPTDEWDWLTLAQHHGLATRLLDWTKSPLNAAFFAVDGNPGEDAAIFAFAMLRKEMATAADPFGVKKFTMYFPRGLSARVVSQRGLFSISPNPSVPLEDQLGDRLHKIIISASAVPDVWRTLALFGVNKLSIYQDLDHMSEHLNDVVLNDQGSPASLPVPPASPPFG